MKKLLLISIMLSAVAVSALAQTITVSRENRTVAVTVTDEAEVEADLAVVGVGFMSYGSDQEQTYTEATRISNRVIDALHAAGIRPDAIQSSDQSLTEIDTEDKVHSAKGLRFRFAQSWKVTVDASSAAQVLHTAISAGANNSGNIQWKLKSEDASEAAAEDKALAHAQKVAERYAAGLKCRLGSMIYASNQMPTRNLFGAMINTEMASIAAGKVNRKPLAIAPEKITRTATVYAVFAIE